MTEATSPRLHQRVLPATVAVGVLVGLAALVVPAFREQLELSLTRQRTPYVELYFARSVPEGGQVLCARRGGSVLVEFVVASHLERPEKVAYRVEVNPARSHLGTLRRSGDLRTAPGQASGVQEVFELPRRQSYSVSVALPDQGQRVRATCPGRSS